ncbi:MAG: hypothetical protein AAF493_28270, partial [Pseudomonadota bacterium]
YAEEDRKFKELASVKNEAEHLIYQAEKVKTDLGDESAASDVDAAIAAVRESLGSTDKWDVERSAGALRELLDRVASEPGTVGEPPPAPETGEDVIDAEFEDVTKH